jgi:hypothetical protein
MSKGVSLDEATRQLETMRARVRVATLATADARTLAQMAATIYAAKLTRNRKKTPAPALINEAVAEAAVILEISRELE